jgi:predicted RNA-binding protein with PUA-like domain
MKTIKLAMIVMVAVLLAFTGTAAAIPHHDWLSPNTVGVIKTTSVAHPDIFSWHTLGHWYTPYFTYVDPWWHANIYRPLGYTSRWYAW